MGFRAKASYLCQTFQAKSYKDACQKLRVPAPKNTPLQKDKMWWNKD